MREIEFRGKQADTKKWVYGDLFRDYIPESNIPYWYINIRTKDQGTIPENVIPTSVGQYTGLKDKNGTKIFEGDIVEVTCKFKGIVEFEECGVVEYGKGDVNLKIFTSEEEFNFPLYENVENNERQDTFIVIGNIHDNPELLESSVE